LYPDYEKGKEGGGPRVNPWHSVGKGRREGKYLETIRFVLNQLLGNKIIFGRRA